MLQRTRTDPTVKPAPTEVRRIKSPFYSLPLSTAVLSASGIVVAVVVPNM